MPNIKTHPPRVPHLPRRTVEATAHSGHPARTKQAAQTAIQPTFSVPETTATSILGGAFSGRHFRRAEPRQTATHIPLPLTLEGARSTAPAAHKK
jgi:hypothetical protein